MLIAVEKYRTEIFESVKALWSVWVPLQFINFAFVPRHLRIPYVAGVSFGWTVILSVMQGKFDAAKQLKNHPQHQHQHTAMLNHEVLASHPPQAPPVDGAATGTAPSQLAPAAATSLEIARSMPRVPIVTTAMAQGTPLPASASVAAGGKSKEA